MKTAAAGLLLVLVSLSGCSNDPQDENRAALKEAWEAQPEDLQLKICSDWEFQHENALAALKEVMPDRLNTETLKEFFDDECL